MKKINFAETVSILAFMIVFSPLLAYIVIIPYHVATFFINHPHITLLEMLKA